MIKHRDTPGRPPRGLAAALTVAVCGLVVIAGAATDKHCQTCGGDDGPVNGGIPPNSGTAGLVHAPVPGTGKSLAARSGSDPSRGQLVLDSLAGRTGGPAASTWIRKTIG